MVDLAGYRLRIDSLRDLIEAFDEEVDVLEDLIHDVLKDHAGYRAIQAIDGVGRTFAAVFVAEIGDVTRFPGPQQLCSWARRKWRTTPRVAAN